MHYKIKNMNLLYTNNLPKIWFWLLKWKLYIKMIFIECYFSFVLLSVYNGKFS